jgi:TIR domain
MSYRREDAAPAAGRVYDRLARLPAAPKVFFDVSTILGGEDFELKILKEIESSDVVLVFIGKKWLEPQAGGKVRIWDSNDYVRAEIRAALARPILVLPILVDGALMPQSEQLPDDVKGILGKNALPLRHERFDDDTENIVFTILGVPARQKAWDDKSKLMAKLGYGAAGLFAACVFLSAVALVHFLIFARPLSASIGDAMTTLLLIVGVIAGAAIGFTYGSRKGWRKPRMVAK